MVFGHIGDTSLAPPADALSKIAAGDRAVPSGCLPKALLQRIAEYNRDAPTICWLLGSGFLCKACRSTLSSTNLPSPPQHGG